MPKKIQPMTLKYMFDLPVVQGEVFVDLAQVASLVNRKFIRQGQEFFVSNLEIITDGDFICTVSKLPETWIFSNSWVKSMALWNEQQQTVLDDEPSIAGKYRDFKIYYDSDHETAGVGANLLPVGYQTSTFGLDEEYDWDSSDIEIPQDGGANPPLRFKLHGIGPDTAGSKGVIRGYALSRARPQQDDPNMPLYGGWMQQISDVDDTSAFVRQNVQENDSPPYPVAPAEGVNQAQEFYPGGNAQANSHQSFIQDYLVTRKTTALAMDNTGPFSAPCGLLRIDTQPGAENPPTGAVLFIELAPGPSKGLLARPMQGVNG